MLNTIYQNPHTSQEKGLTALLMRRFWFPFKKPSIPAPNCAAKKQLINSFIAGINDVDDVLNEWNDFVSTEREKELIALIQEEHLKEPETRKFLENAFRDGEIKTTGTDIDSLMPPVSRFGGGRAQKKQGVIDKLKAFFEKFFGIGRAKF